MLEDMSEDPCSVVRASLEKLLRFGDNEWICTWIRAQLCYVMIPNRTRYSQCGPTNSRLKKEVIRLQSSAYSALYYITLYYNTAVHDVVSFFSPHLEVDVPEP